MTNIPNLPTQLRKTKLKQLNLIELGAKGHFPLFELNWIIEHCQSSAKSVGSKKIFNKINENLKKHKSITRKKTYLLSLSANDRQTYVNHFLKNVEEFILNKGINLQ